MVTVFKFNLYIVNYFPPYFSDGRGQVKQPGHLGNPSKSWNYFYNPHFFFVVVQILSGINTGGPVSALS